jgi:uncharacterized membrane protein
MARVLLLGESWFVHSIHQKGFDTFTTSEYTEGGSEFVAALSEAGHEVRRIPAHLIAQDFPTTAEGIAAIADVVVVSDVGANTFLLSPETFNDSIPGANRLDALRSFVNGGGSLLMVGGYMTFSGVDAKARWGRSVIADVLPVTLHDRDDRVELPEGASASVVEPHPITAGVDRSWPPLLGVNEVQLADRGTLLAEINGLPLLVVGTSGLGRAAVFTSDLAPHWATPDFMRWNGYRTIFDRTIQWLNGQLA